MATINRPPQTEIQRERLVSLIDFANQSARLKGKPASAISQHKLFALYEEQIQGLPGIRLNVNGRESDDEIWLSVERLHQTQPPAVESPFLAPWIQLINSPSEEPTLVEAIRGDVLVAAGTHRPSGRPANSAEEEKKPEIDPSKSVSLSEYDKATTVRALFTNYISTKWQPWSVTEKLRRKTISYYSHLFTLKQQLEGGIVEAQLELVWGVGLGVWRCRGVTISYPLIGRLVEIALNPENAEIEIRPRDVDARLEIDWYASVDNPGVTTLEKAAKQFFESSNETFSPFDRATFEPLLRTAVTHLDANGIYWPGEVAATDRAAPKAEERLKVTDTWVLFARPRTNSLFIQDLERLKSLTEEAEHFPPAVSSVVTDPSTDNPETILPSFRGVSASYHEACGGAEKLRDLYFPKLFNDEQVRIVQLLEINDGVVVQGPPGTGKTHTIANIICHYLANGKRVLVTSMKDPALAVLQEQLPADIRPLAISLLSSEQEGMKQFEYAIKKIASEVQGLDRPAMARGIKHLDESIDALHAKLAHIDNKISSCAKRNLTKIAIEGMELEPEAAARELVDNAEQYEFIPDDLKISSEYSPQFTDEDVIKLRDARRILGFDIGYWDRSLPQLSDFPDSKALLEVHQDLSQHERLQQGIEKGSVPAMADSSQATLSLAQELCDRIEELRTRRNKLLASERPWMSAIRNSLKNDNDVLKILEALGIELDQAVNQRKQYLTTPVSTPPDIEMDQDIIAAVNNLAEGKSPFGLMGLFGKADKKKLLDSIRVLGSKPNNTEQWKIVSDYLSLLKGLRELAIRWNALAHDLRLDTVSNSDPSGGLAAADNYALYVDLKCIVKAESTICSLATKVFPGWENARLVADNLQHLSDLETALRHHLTKSRLANVWAAKERFQKVLDGKSGKVVDDIRHFLADTLGNPEVDDAKMQAEWSAFMSELYRITGLSPYLATISEVCEKIKRSGAPQYASLLTRPLAAPVDTLLPINWRKCWQLKQLSCYLESIDAQEELKKLAKERQGVAADLSKAYQDVVVSRTRLKLAENASHSIRAALQAYLNAIQKIGKGTGKRAIRYRQEARMAASKANPAVPCWIMPHYRVSESLPAELGCFDLVVIDEASQSDLTALPSLLRAKKVLIVGDDKQVSPEGVGLEEDKIKNLMVRFLGRQVETYRPQMTPERSIYDLFKVVFSKSAVMLKEHFRCVSPIIEYSKREFYNHELRPLRVPRASEKLEPPLIDVFVNDGYRKGDINLSEARFIVDEIKSIIADPKMDRRSIGVVSLLADKQALKVWDMLTEEVGPELMQRHRFACGDARTFQGKERDIMFLSMVSAPNEVGAPLSRDTFAQRFNVAASRARDRMYLVRSVDISHLSEADKLRRSLIGHFASPYAKDEARVADLRSLCESPFEREMYDELTQRGYWVTPQVQVGQYRIDLVVEGHNDSRLAIECDGDRYHGIDKWADDMNRQRVLERAGWVFWRCFASVFFTRRLEILEELIATLSERGIDPIGAEGAPQSVYVEHRDYVSKVACEETEEEVFTKNGNTEEQPVPSDETQSPEVKRISDPALTIKEKRIIQPQVFQTSVPQESVLVQVKQFARANKLSTEDKRSKGGCFWVYYRKKDDTIAKQLSRWGFRFSPVQGWWYKGKM